MHIHIHSKNIDLDDAEKGYVESKIMKVAEHGGRVGDESTEIRVEIDKMTMRHASHNPIKVEVTMRVPHAIIRAEGKGGSVEEAADAVEDKLMRQVGRYKDKMHRRDKQGKWIPESTIDEVTKEEELVPNKILKRKRLDSLQPMVEEEAVENMELLGHDFFLFFNKNTGRVAVLYKRKDGYYGIIEPTGEGGFVS